MVTKVPPVYLLVSSLLLISSRALMSAIKHWCWYLERVQRPPRQRHSGLPPLRCPSALYKNQDEATEATRKKCAQASILASKWKPWKRPLQQKAASGLCSHAKHINGANTMLLSLMSVSSFFLFSFWQHKSWKYEWPHTCACSGYNGFWSSGYLGPSLDF